MRHIILMFNLSCGTWQDVVDIMKESLYDKYVDEHGYVDFARSGGMSQPKEAKRFLNALNKESELQQKDCFSKTVSSITIRNLLCLEEKPLLHFEHFSFLVTFSLQKKKKSHSLVNLFFFRT
jgi:DNA helicase MCM8